MPVADNSQHGYAIGYERGELFARQLDPNSGYLAAAYVPGAFADTSVTVDAHIVGDTTRRILVLACRAGDGSGYRFNVEPWTAQVNLTRWDAGVETQLVNWTQATPRTLTWGMDTNNIGLVCDGDQITGLVNGVDVISSHDDHYHAGRLWMGTGSLGRTGVTEARFANLIVVQGGKVITSSNPAGLAALANQVPTRSATLRSRVASDGIPVFATPDDVGEYVIYYETASDPRNAYTWRIQHEVNGRLTYALFDTRVTVLRERDYTARRGYGGTPVVFPVTHVRIDSGQLKGQERWVESTYVTN